VAALTKRALGEAGADVAALEAAAAAGGAAAAGASVPRSATVLLAKNLPYVVTEAELTVRACAESVTSSGRAELMAQEAWSAGTGKYWGCVCAWCRPSGWPPSSWHPIWSGAQEPAAAGRRPATSPRRAPRRARDAARRARAGAVRRLRAAGAPGAAADARARAGGVRGARRRAPRLPRARLQAAAPRAAVPGVGARRRARGRAAAGRPAAGAPRALAAPLYSSAWCWALRTHRLRLALSEASQVALRQALRV